ncbi:MAG: hypothetical protein LQ346_007621 [Caloplaca aetnensis]|nr:MAG: hypothetical protein LQ346_007621 [Caloplaca aetnensis]
MHAEGSRTPKVFWSKPATVPHSLGGPLGFATWGIDFIERSNATVSDRKFLVSALWVLDDIYHTRNNGSEVVRNYQFGGGVDFGYPPILNISAVGRGRDPASPFAFNNAAMALFIAYLGQISRARRWETFGCYLGVFAHVGGSNSERLP